MTFLLIDIQSQLEESNNHHQRGGVLVHVVFLSNSAPAKHRDDLEPPHFEIIAIELQLQQEKVLICNCYWPPHKDVIDFVQIFNQ